MTNKTLTIKQLAEELSCDYLQASALVGLLVKQGVVTESGNAPHVGKGKPSRLYSIPNEVTLVFWSDDAEGEENVTEVMPVV